MANLLPDLSAGPDDVAVERLRQYLDGPQPDFAAVRRSLGSLPATRAALRTRAERLLQTMESLRRVPGETAAPARWLNTALGILGVAIVGVLGVVGYHYWPCTGADCLAPLAADPPFPQAFPLFTTEAGRTVTMQHGRLSALHIVPAPAEVGLDDSLKKWDCRGLFHASWAAPYAEQYYVDGVLMMDAKYLYVGAKVGDPWPLRNAHDAKPSHDGGWAGGAVQLRLATPPPSTDARTASPAVGDRLFHLTFWDGKEKPQDKEEDRKALLHVARGMTFAEMNTPLIAGQQDFDGRFHKECDGQGYVMKCRVPWKLLGLDHAPYGAELGLCWEVCWSDQNGEQHIGKLTEFYDPQALQRIKDGDPATGAPPALGLPLPGNLSYTRSDVWGKAICPTKP